MTKYRSKPVEIEAFRWPTGIEPEWFLTEIREGRAFSQGVGLGRITVQSASGPVTAVDGDWIIREPSGIGCYPCKPEVFAAKYELVE